MKANPRVARESVEKNDALRGYLLAHAKYVELNIYSLCQPHCNEGHAQSHFTSQQPHFPIHLRSLAPGVKQVQKTGIQLHQP